MPKQHQKLEHPIWNALSESHQACAIVYDELKFYHPDYGPFGSLPRLNTSVSGLTAYAELIGTFYVIGVRPRLPDHLTVTRELPCSIMVLEKPITLKITEEVQRLEQKHLPELTRLINLVQPGYFRSRTFELGNYFGIFKGGQLISISGERMRMEGYTEVSAIITHPEHTRRGYARQLIKYTTDGIFADGQTPFLHVASSNTPAIRLYEKLGFQTLHHSSFWQIESK